MKRILFFFGSSCEQSRNSVKLPCIEPTVGMQPCGAMPMSRNARMKREACSFSSGMPDMLGYCDATPCRRALHSASTPTCSGGSPGTPISRCRNSVPVSFSSMRAMSPDWRMVACAMSAMSMRSSAESSTERSSGSRSIIRSVFVRIGILRGTPRGSSLRSLDLCGRRWRGCRLRASRR